MSKVIGIIAAILCVALISCAIYFSATPGGRAAWNSWFFAVQKADDATLYETRKQVEDSCRAMMASYNTDKLTWMQYKDSDSAEKVGWAEQAKMRANKTASSYNEYVLKNSFVWEGNVPTDIQHELQYIP